MNSKNLILLSILIFLFGCSKEPISPKITIKPLDYFTQEPVSDCTFSYEYDDSCFMCVSSSQEVRYPIYGLTDLEFNSIFTDNGNPFRPKISSDIYHSTWQYIFFGRDSMNYTFEYQLKPLVPLKLRIKSKIPLNQIRGIAEDFEIIFEENSNKTHNKYIEANEIDLERYKSFTDTTLIIPVIQEDSLNIHLSYSHYVNGVFCKGEGLIFEIITDSKDEFHKTIEIEE